MLGPILSHNCLPNPLQSILVYKWLVVAVAEAEAGAFRDQGADLEVGRGVVEGVGWAAWWTAWQARIEDDGSKLKEWQCANMKKMKRQC